MSNDNEGGLSCSMMCWIIGVLTGIAAYLLASGRFGLDVIVSLILAIAVFLILGALLRRLFCADGQEPFNTHPSRHDHDIAADANSVLSADSNGAMPSSVPATTAKVTSADVTAQSAKVSSSIANSKSKTATKPKAAAKPKAETVAKGAAKPKAKTATKPKPKAVAKPKAKTATKAAAKLKAKAATKPAAKAKAAPKPKAAAKPARKPVAADGKPEMLKKARASGADDLKQIKGVGPKMETTLNKMGFYHFDQVAGWRVKEVKWVDENLEGFKGRVSRDEWVKQAKVLAKGGQTEFSKKVQKGGVYAKKK